MKKQEKSKRTRTDEKTVSYTVYQMNLLTFLHYTPQRDYGVCDDGFRNPLKSNHN